MKKKTNKKLALNKQKISELSEGNLGDVKGGCSFDIRCTDPRTLGFACTGTDTGFICPPPDLSFDFYGCRTIFEEK